MKDLELVMWEVRHNKTGNIYMMLTDKAICATNSIDGDRYVIYKKNEKYFVREYSEFWEKFVLLEEDSE